MKCFKLWSEKDKILVSYTVNKPHWVAVYETMATRMASNDKKVSIEEARRHYRLRLSWGYKPVK